MESPPSPKKKKVPVLKICNFCKEKLRDGFMKCTKCYLKYHFDCTGIKSSNARLIKNFICFNCDPCFKCGVEDESTCVICDACNRNFHDRCMDPPLTIPVPKDKKWFCEYCSAKLCGRCKGPTHAFATGPCISCQSCESCSLCDNPYYEYQNTTKCLSCNLYFHQACNQSSASDVIIIEGTLNVIKCSLCDEKNAEKNEGNPPSRNSFVTFDGVEMRRFQANLFKDKFNKWNKYEICKMYPLGSRLTRNSRINEYEFEKDEMTDEMTEKLDSHEDFFGSTLLYHSAVNDDFTKFDYKESKNKFENFPTSLGAIQTAELRRCIDAENINAALIEEDLEDDLPGEDFTKGFGDLRSPVLWQERFKFEVSTGSVTRPRTRKDMNKYFVKSSEMELRPRVQKENMRVAQLVSEKDTNKSGATPTNGKYDAFAQLVCGMSPHMYPKRQNIIYVENENFVDFTVSTPSTSGPKTPFESTKEYNGNDVTPMLDNQGRGRLFDSGKKRRKPLRACEAIHRLQATTRNSANRKKESDEPTSRYNLRARKGLNYSMNDFKLRKRDNLKTPAKKFDNLSVVNNSVVKLVDYTIFKFSTPTFVLE